MLSIMPFHFMYNKLHPDKLALLNGGWTLPHLIGSCFPFIPAWLLLIPSSFIWVWEGARVTPIAPLGRALYYLCLKIWPLPLLLRISGLSHFFWGFVNGYPGIHFPWTLILCPMLSSSSRSVVSDSLQPHGLQLGRLPYFSSSPGVCSDSSPLSQWCHPTISSSVVPFSSCLQSFPASGSFPMSELLASGGQSIGTYQSHKGFRKQSLADSASPIAHVYMSNYRGFQPQGLFLNFAQDHLPLFFYKIENCYHSSQDCINLEVNFLP